MKITQGQVTVNESPVKSNLFRYCEKKIDQWLETHEASIASITEPAEFRVSFTEEPESKQVSCVTEIQFGSRILRGCDVDGNSQSAFLHSLKHLHTAVPTAEQYV